MRLSIRQPSASDLQLPAPGLWSGGISQKVVREGIASERFEERDQISLFLRAEAQRRNLLRAVESTRGATLIIEIDHIRQRREPSGVHIGRGLGDVAQARGAKCASVGRILGERGKLGLSGDRVVAELTGSAEHVAAQAVDRAEPALVMRGNVWTGLWYAEIVKQVIGERGPRVAGRASALAKEDLSAPLG